MENNINSDVKDEIEMDDRGMADNIVFIKEEDKDPEFVGQIKKEEDPLYISEFSDSGEIYCKNS